MNDARLLLVIKFFLHCNVAASSQVKRLTTPHTTSAYQRRHLLYIYDNSVECGTIKEAASVRRGCSVVSVENTKLCICTPLTEDNSLSSPG